MTAEPSGWDAYAGAVVRIEAPGGVVWVQPAPVTRNAGQYPDPEGRPICVITAHNPGGRMASDAANASAEARLSAELDRRGLTWWPAAGGDPSWTHIAASAAVIGMDEADAIALGAEFGQDAIFVLTPADRRVVSCADGRVAATGWSILHDGDAVGSAREHRESEEPAAAVAAGQDEEDEEPYGAPPVVEVTVYTENFLTGEQAAGFQDYDDYMAWIGRHEGLLSTLRCAEGVITLHGDGQGGVLIHGAWDGPEGPFPVTDVLQRIADAGVFESDVEFESAAWGQGDVATLVVRYADYADYDEFLVDGNMWSARGGRAEPEFPRDVSAFVLAESTWELEPGGMPSPGSGETGAEVLLRIGPRYIVHYINGSEWESEGLDAADDEAAVAAFKAAIGAV